MEIIIKTTESGKTIEKDAKLFGEVVERVAKDFGATKIIIEGKTIVEYGLEDTRMIKDLARKIKTLSAELKGKIPPKDCSCEEIRVFFNKVREIADDPIGVYVFLKRLKQRVEIGNCSCKGWIIDELINPAMQRLEETDIVRKVQKNLVGYRTGDRDIYMHIFSPTERPSFSLTRFRTTFPANGKLVDEYELKDGAKVRIFKLDNEIKYYYHLTPPEITLGDMEHRIVSEIREEVIKDPKAEMLDSAEAREAIYEYVRDKAIAKIEELKLNLKVEDADKLASIVTRATIGFGVIESILHDPYVQDVNINPGERSIAIFHEKWEECNSNIIPNVEEVVNWATKLKLEGGRPLDQANPVLDTTINIPGMSARIASVHKPLSTGGLAFAIRKHREKPWTFPLFIREGMMNEMAAGLLSFAIDNGRCILFGGSRSAGKTSLLGASLLEIMKKYRIVTIEDTLELPVKTMEELGYDILSLKVKSALSIEGSEMSAEDGIKAALRLGDSCLIVGEVRSKEAKALFEAMRVGALANVVAGTIHGESPYGIFDRVVNDLEVPPASFKAIDLIVIANPIKTPDGLEKLRRVTRITEVRKHWKDDPIEEMGFVDLMVYDANKDTLVPTDALLNGESEILKAIGERVAGWGDYSKIMENIKLRAKMKRALVDFAKSYNNEKILEAPFVVASNSALHMIMEAERKEYGNVDSTRVFEKWKAWCLEEMKRVY